MWHQPWNCELSLEYVLKLSWVSLNLNDSWISLYLFPVLLLEVVRPNQDAHARFSGWMVRQYIQFPPKMTITMSSYVKMSRSKISSLFLKKMTRIGELKRQLTFSKWSNKSSSPTSILEVTLGEFLKQLFQEFPPLTPKFSNSLSWRVFKTTLLVTLPCKQ